MIASAPGCNITLQISCLEQELLQLFTRCLKSKIYCFTLSLCLLCITHPPGKEKKKSTGAILLSGNVILQQHEDAFLGKLQLCSSQAVGRNDLCRPLPIEPLYLTRGDDFRLQDIQNIRMHFCCKACWQTAQLIAIGADTRSAGSLLKQHSRLTEGIYLCCRPCSTYWDGSQGRVLSSKAPCN